MTNPETRLDERVLFRESPLILYRLARRKYADTLAGQGSALYPGRWNAPGEQALYTSTQPAVCVLERLAHTPKDRIPRDLAMMKIAVRGDWNRDDAWTSRESSSHSSFLHFRSLQDAESSGFPFERADDFSVTTVAVAVPSVIVPAWNVVLYPGAAFFWEYVSLESVEPFDYDPRLFPEGTPWESQIG